MPTTVQVAADPVEVVPEMSKEKYLGRVVCIGEYHKAELSSRLTSAWRCFAKFKDVLCSRSYPLRSRLRLFEAVVTPTALYGSECWTLGAVDRNRLRVAWRKMARKIFRVTRGAEESWVEYIKRATIWVESACAEWGFQNLAIAQASRKFTFATKVSSADS